MTRLMNRFIVLAAAAAALAVAIGSSVLEPSGVEARDDREVIQFTGTPTSFGPFDASGFPTVVPSSRRTPREGRSRSPLVSARSSRTSSTARPAPMTRSWPSTSLRQKPGTLETGISSSSNPATCQCRGWRTSMAVSSSSPVTISGSSPEVRVDSRTCRAMST